LAVCISAGAGAQDARQLFVIPHKNAVRAAAFSPDGRTVLTGGFRNTLRLFEAAGGKELRTFAGGPDRTVVVDGDGGQVNAVAFAPDGQTALSGHVDGTLRLWDVASGLMLRLFRGPPFQVQAVAFAPDGRSALSGGVDATLRHWDVATATVRQTFAARVGIDRVAIAPNGRVAATSGLGDARLWDLVTGFQIRIFTPYALATAPDGRFALVSSVGNVFTERDPGGLWELQAYKLAQQKSRINYYALSPDGKTLLAGVGDRPLLWDLTNARDIHRFQGHTKPFVQVVAFAPDGRTAISGGDDMTLRKWDLSGLQ
jgi:WD40 repeat protein